MAYFALGPEEVLTCELIGESSPGPRPTQSLAPELVTRKAARISAEKCPEMEIQEEGEAAGLVFAFFSELGHDRSVEIPLSSSSSFVSLDEVRSFYSDAP